MPHQEKHRNHLSSIVSNKLPYAFYSKSQILVWFIQWLLMPARNSEQIKVTRILKANNDQEYDEDLLWLSYQPRCGSDYVEHNEGRRWDPADSRLPGDSEANG